MVDKLQSFHVIIKSFLKVPLTVAKAVPNGAKNGQKIGMHLISALYVKTAQEQVLS